MIKQSYFIVPPIIIGAVFGANLAVDIPETLMRATIGTIMIGLLITMLFNWKNGSFLQMGLRTSVHRKFGWPTWD